MALVAEEKASKCQSHSHTVLQQWGSFKKISAEKNDTAIDGHSLDIATVVAIARLMISSQDEISKLIERKARSFSPPARQNVPRHCRECEAPFIKSQPGRCHIW